MSLQDSPQDNARPHKLVCGHGFVAQQSRRTHPDQPKLETSQHPHSTRTAPTRATLAALERVMYRGQWLLIGADNRKISTVRSLDALRNGLATGAAVTAAARLVDGVHGADIDAEDSVIGDAVAEALVAWCVKHALPYLVRESGRPGGRHVITAITHHHVSPAEWHTLCGELAEAFGVVVDDRTDKALRLLTAPHRLGSSSRVISCTLSPGDVVDARNLYDGIPSAAHTGSRRPKPARSIRGVPGPSRSEAEFRVAMVLARRGYTMDEAWTELHHQLNENAKAFGQGRDWWERYVWLIAMTKAAAEQGLSPTQAWTLVERDRLSSCGRKWWDELWSLSKDEAAGDRPRAVRLVGELSPTALDSADPGAADAMRRGLHHAVGATLSGVDPRRRHSVLVVLCALVPALLTREGSMSMRQIAERGHVYTSTVQTAIATAVEYGLLTVAHRYPGGARACQTYALGPTAERHVREAESSPHTSCSTPAPLGDSSPSKLSALHSGEREAWTPRSDVLSSVAPGDRLATSAHPVAKNLRSQWVQKQWWVSLTAEQQAERIRLRRIHLGQLHPSLRRTWFTWLDERAGIVAAATTFIASSPKPAPEAAAVLAAAPVTLHRGLRALKPNYQPGAHDVQHVLAA
ncbi:hypothetical protein QX204_34025 (plasmid) [Nocardia sp. PE-7]|uniref:hypothetical protein n=1 Tax=Nocardia sp. PE-7 TaxID=3058426 RepID=UPI00265B6C59|nr:hypothetical protein [Nocardia sp. PE-7]WKG13574.1 hypothetical protein QX204_34025 [Nocardia sp. PE-7]